MTRRRFDDHKYYVIQNELNDPESQRTRVYRYIENNSGATIEEIANAIGIEMPGVRDRVKKLFYDGKIKISDGESPRSDKEQNEIRIKEDLAAIELENEFFEGVKKSRLSNFYERNPKLRLAAIKVHGLACKICGFNFSDSYGDHGMGFIEVHHLKPVSTLNTPTKVCPENDMIVVCANCHRMLHRNKDAVLTPEQLKELLHYK